MSSFLIAVPLGGAVLDAGQFSGCAGALRAGALGAVRVAHPGRAVVLHAPLVTGDSRVDESCVERIGLVAAGQVRLDDREAVVRRLRGFGLDASESDSDIALFAAAWQHYGAHAPEYLIGDFAVAVWEPILKRLSLARDRFGVRLMYYAATRDMLVASNSLRGVLASPAVTAARANPSAVADFVAQGMNGNAEATFYENVHRVPPAHVVALGERKATRAYWRLEDVAAAPIKGRDYPSYFRHTLTHAVRDRWRGQQTSILMSGSLASVTLAALAARELTQPSLLHAITLELPTVLASEDAVHTRLIAKRLGIGHTVIDGDLFGFTEGVHGSAEWQTAEPLDEHDLALWRAMLQKAAAHSATLLCSDGAEELFASGGLRALVRRGSGHPRSEAVARLTAAAWQPLFESLDARNIGVAIDARLPYLDLRVIAAAFSAPAAPWTQRKRLLREAMRGLLPETARHLSSAQQHAAGSRTSRLAQWRTRQPEPFAPSEALRACVPPAALDRAAAARDAEAAMLQLRLRVLDRWLGQL